VSNIDVVEQIRGKLDDDPRIAHPAEIAISEREGTVTLRGSVGGLRQRHAAVEIATSVQGVRQVEDQLKVDLLDRYADDETRGAALEALMSDDAVPADRIDVIVDDGWLTLKGDVEHQGDSDAAFQHVRGLPGVGGVTNEIRVITAGIDG
jgi:osmotically-inducible protein OsmY